MTNQRDTHTDPMLPATQTSQKNKRRLVIGGVLLLVLLAGFGVSLSVRSSTPPPLPSGSPTSVRLLLNDASGWPVLTLTDVKAVQRLYTTIDALPAIPSHQVCTTNLGPFYTLTFRHGTTTLAMVTVDPASCGSARWSGGGRQLTGGFLNQLNQAVSEALTETMPLPSSISWVAIERPLGAGLPPETARILSAHTSQQLYQAFLTLPKSANAPDLSASSPISDSFVLSTVLANYQLAFHAGGQTILLLLDQQTSQLFLEGTDVESEGFHDISTFWHLLQRASIGDAFRQQFADLVKGMTFTPATPDVAFLTPFKGNTFHLTETTDVSLLQPLYRQILSLPRTPGPPSPQACPMVTSAEKHIPYEVSFWQWGLPLFLVQGSGCYLGINPGGPTLQGNQQFWDLLQRVNGGF